MPRKKPRLERYMIRPVIYKTSSRFLCALTAALLWNEFVNTGGLWPKSRAFVFFGVLFAAAGWLAYLRVDGARIPKLPKNSPAAGTTRCAPTATCPTTWMTKSSPLTTWTTTSRICVCCSRTSSPPRCSS